ncbi:MAG: zeta toxin family protein [Capsulimonadales bacterium]|nr:zeta toxin family protein [Capsulimonadales bacterium]
MDVTTVRDRENERSDRPSILILAGPNGAGKSTVQPFLVPSTMAFVNADNIARDLRSAGASKGVATDIAAGRLLIRDMDRLTALRESFCVETNLANSALAQRITTWRAVGYRVTVYYLWIPSPDLAVARVAQRVASGGHDIPEGTIRRRYYLGLRNFFEVYMPIADRWRLYDSSGSGEPQLIEWGTRRIVDDALWRNVRAIAFTKGATDDSTGTTGI